MYTLYIANKNYSSWSLRAWILMKELSLTFEEVIFPFRAGSDWSEYKSQSPGGKVPWLKDGDITVWDTMAITGHLAEQYPDVWPDDPSARAWARSAVAEMHAGFSALRTVCAMSCGVRVRLNEIDASLQSDISRINALWLDGLEKFGGPFLAGNRFSAVDAFFAPVVFRIRTYDLPVDDQCAAYIEHMLSLASMREWEAAALQESWRDPEHEEDIIKYGEVLEDYRQ